MYDSFPIVNFLFLTSNFPVLSLHVESVLSRTRQTLYLYLNLHFLNNIFIILDKTNFTLIGSSPGRIKPKIIKLVFVAFPISTLHWGKRAKTGWFRSRIMCPNGATCLPTDGCCSELALWKSNSTCWSSTKRTLSSSHWKLTCSRHDMSE